MSNEEHYKSAWENTLDHYNADTQKWNDERYNLGEQIRVLGCQLFIAESFAERRLLAINNLTAELSRLRRCGNCRHFWQYSDDDYCKITNLETDIKQTCDKWEIYEND